eukprot:scaffold3028_cov37-Phaeocystis_antarctica.AAC.2
MSNHRMNISTCCMWTRRHHHSGADIRFQTGRAPAAQLRSALAPAVSFSAVARLLAREQLPRHLLHEKLLLAPQRKRSGAPGDPVCEARLFLREISFLARRLDYTKGRQGGGSAAASRAKLSQQMLCRRVECAVVAHQVTLPPKERLPPRVPRHVG